MIGSFCLVISVVGQMKSAKCSVNLTTAVGGLIVSGVCQVDFVFAMAAQNHIIIVMTHFEIVSGCRPLHPYTAYRLLCCPLSSLCRAHVDIGTWDDGYPYRHRHAYIYYMRIGRSRRNTVEQCCTMNTTNLSRGLTNINTRHVTARNRIQPVGKSTHLSISSARDGNSNMYFRHALLSPP